MLQRARRVQYCITACLSSAVLCYSVLGECSLALRHVQWVMSHVTVCSASAALRYGLLGACYLALTCARRVLFSVTACSASAISCYSVLGECSLVLQHALQVMSHVTVCSTSAVLRYSMLGECSLMLQCARWVQPCVTVCSASAVLRYGLLGKWCLMLQCARWVQSCVTACSASDVSCCSVLGECSLVLRLISSEVTLWGHTVLVGDGIRQTHLTGTHWCLLDCHCRRCVNGTSCRMNQYVCACITTHWDDPWGTRAAHKLISVPTHSKMYHTNDWVIIHSLLHVENKRNCSFSDKHHIRFIISSSFHWNVRSEIVIFGYISRLSNKFKSWKLDFWIFWKFLSRLHATDNSLLCHSIKNIYTT